MAQLCHTKQPLKHSSYLSIVIEDLALSYRFYDGTMTDAIMQAHVNRRFDRIRSDWGGRQLDRFLPGEADPSEAFEASEMKPRAPLLVESSRSNLLPLPFKQREPLFRVSTV